MSQAHEGRQHGQQELYTTAQACQFFANAGDQARARWEEVGGWRGLGGKFAAGARTAKEQMKDLSSRASCRAAPATSGGVHLSISGSPPPLPPPCNTPTSSDATWGRWSQEACRVPGSGVSAEQAGEPLTTRVDSERGYNIGAQAGAKWEEVGGWAGVGEQVMATAKSTKEKAMDLDEKHRITDKVKEGLEKTGTQIQSSAKSAKARARVLDRQYGISRAAFTSADKRLAKKASSGASKLLTKLANINCA